MFDPGHPFERLLFGLHLLPMLLAPWCFGGNRDWIWSWLLVLAILSSMLAMALCRLDARRQQHLMERGRPLFWAWLFVIVLLWLSLLFSPWLDLADARASLRMTMMLTAMGVYAIVLVLLCHSRRRLRWAMMAVFVNGATLAMTGLVVALSGLQWSWLGLDLAAVPVARVPFINRNHFAGYLAVCGALGFGLLSADLAAKHHVETWAQRMREWLALLLSRKLFVRTLLVVIVIGLIVSQSRMGNLAFGIGLAIGGALALCFWRPLPPGLLPLVISIFVLDVLIAGSWFGLDRLQQRFRETAVLDSAETALTADSQAAAVVVSRSGTEPSDDERFRVAFSGLRLLHGHYLLGVGVGGFRLAYPAFKPEAIMLHYQHAHNDWIQTLVERGILGLLGIVAIVGFAVRACIRVVRLRQDRLLRGVATGLLTAYAVIALHALADFNLQIPAYLWLVHVLLALSVNVMALPERATVKLK